MKTRDWKFYVDIAKELKTIKDTNKKNGELIYSLVKQYRSADCDKRDDIIDNLARLDGRFSYASAGEGYLLTQEEAKVIVSAGGYNKYLKYFETDPQKANVALDEIKTVLMGGYADACDFVIERFEKIIKNAEYVISRYIENDTLAEILCHNAKSNKDIKELGELANIMSAKYDEDTNIQINEHLELIRTLSAEIRKLNILKNYENEMKQADRQEANCEVI